jgi:hypothetical protein
MKTSIRDTSPAFYRSRLILKPAYCRIMLPRPFLETVIHRACRSGFPVSQSRSQTDRVRLNNHNLEQVLARDASHSRAAHHWTIAKQAASIPSGMCDQHRRERSAHEPSTSGSCYATRFLYSWGILWEV